MKRVAGIGGIFFKAKDPDTLVQWYENHLGLTPQGGSFVFSWKSVDEPAEAGQTVLAFFPGDTEYFKPSEKGHMLNLRVGNLVQLLAELKKEGVNVDEKVEEYEYGIFGWIMDPEGNRIELWEPRKEKP